MTRSWHTFFLFFFFCWWPRNCIDLMQAENMLSDIDICVGGVFRHFSSVSSVPLRPNRSRCSVALKQPHLNMPQLTWAKHTPHLPTLFPHRYHVSAPVLWSFPPTDVFSDALKKLCKTPHLHTLCQHGWITSRLRRPNILSYLWSPACLTGSSCERIISVDMDY